MNQTTCNSTKQGPPGGRSRQSSKKELTALVYIFIRGFSWHSSESPWAGHPFTVFIDCRNANEAEIRIIPKSTILSSTGQFTQICLVVFMRIVSQGTSLSRHNWKQGPLSLVGQTLE